MEQGRKEGRQCTRIELHKPKNLLVAADVNHCAYLAVDRSARFTPVSPAVGLSRAPLGVDE